MNASQDQAPAPDPGTPPKTRGGGPRTPEGKAAASRNALNHGMYARVLLPDDLEAVIIDRIAELLDEFQPRSAYERWLVTDMARASAWIDRCAALGLGDLRRGITRAQLCWDDDRRALVDDLAARLPRDPKRVARALGRSRQGADWLAEHWQGLGEVLRANGGWTEGQRRLALDLLGVPPDLRDGTSALPEASDVAGLSELVARQLKQLDEDRERSLIALDEAERGMAAAGMPLHEDAATARLRRHEASCRRAWHAARAELLRVRAGAALAAATEPSSSSLDEPAAVPPMEPSPWIPPEAPEPSAIEIAPAAEIEAEVEGHSVTEEPPLRRSPVAMAAMLTPRPTSGNRRARRAQASRARQASRIGAPDR